MRAYRIIISQEAAHEMELSYHYYENKQRGLGERFKENLDEIFALIIRNPEIFHVVEDSFRQAVLKVFPFVVIFEMKGNEIRVYSIFHTSRNPARKFRRKYRS